MYHKAMLLARLNHPHIVRFYGTVYTRSSPPSLFLVTERCRENLGSVIARKGLIEAPQLVDIYDPLFQL